MKSVLMTKHRNLENHRWWRDNSCCNRCWKGAFGGLPTTCQSGTQQQESGLSPHGGEVLVT